MNNSLSKNHQWTRRLIGVVVSVALFTASVTVADEIDEKINKLEGEVDNTKTQISEKQNQATTLQGRIDELSQEIVSINERLKKTEGEIESTEKQINQLNKKIDKQKGVLRGLIQEDYQNSRVLPLDVLASSGTLSTIVQHQQYVTSVEDKTSEVFQGILADKKTLDEQQAQLVEQQTKLKGEQSLTEQVKAEQGQLLDATKGEEANYQALLNGQLSELDNLYALRAAAHATVGGTGGYPAKWANAPQDSLVDDWYYYNRECVSYVAWRRATDGRPTSGYGNAGAWPVDSSEPSVGAVAVWGGSVGPYGHVGYVEAVNADGSILISQYNWNIAGEYSTMTVSPSDGYWPSKGFLK